MLRRNKVSLRFQWTDADKEPAVVYNAFNWHYSLPQTMIRPQSINRTMSAPSQPGVAYPWKYPTVFVPLEGVHPTFRVALDPYLKKLAMSKAMPTTEPQEAVDDYKRIAPLVGDFSSRMGWLAKVIQLCGMHSQHDLAKTLWDQEAEAAYVAGDKTPPVSLVIAYLYSACKGKQAEEAQRIFDCCCKDKWNLSPKFGTKTWDHLFKCAGNADSESLAVSVWREAIDVNAHLDAVGHGHWVYCLNTIKSEENYEFMKASLFKLSDWKIRKIGMCYTRFRTPEVSHTYEGFPGKVDLKENEKVYYHVVWHSKIRSPMSFNPRQLYFDHKSSSVSDDVRNQKFESIIENRVAKWKADGLLPADYVVPTDIAVDKEKNYKKLLRTKYTEMRNPKSHALTTPKNCGVRKI